MSAGPFCELCGGDTRGREHYQKETEWYLCVPCMFCVDYLVSSLNKEQHSKLFKKLKSARKFMRE